MSVRHGVSSALAALAVSVALAGSAMAADTVPTVVVLGSIVDTDGQPAVVALAHVAEYETPDSAPVLTTLNVAPDGTFAVELRAWGTPELPARAVFTAFAFPSEPIVDANGCTMTTTAFGTLELEIPGDVLDRAIGIVLDKTAEQGLCPPVTATPEPAITLPPTDAGQDIPAIADRGPTDALLILATWLLALASLLRSRRAVR